MKTILYPLCVLFTLRFSAFAQIQGPSYADLMMESLETDTLEVAPGGFNKVDVLHYNLGDSAAARNQVTVKLFADPTGADSGYVLVDYAYSPPVAAHSVVPGLFYFPTPVDVPEGLYYLHIMANSAMEVPESDRSNNVLVVPCYLRLSAFDMSLSFVDTNTLYVNPDRSVKTLLKEENSGPTMSLDHLISYYLSEDTIFSFPEDLLLRTTNGAGIPFSNRITEITVDIPGYVPLGSYYLIVEYWEPKIKEQNTANNYAHKKLVVGNFDIDISLSEFLFTNPLVTRPDGSLFIDVYENSVGADSVNAHQFGFYLSQNEGWDTTDLLLTKIEVAKYKAGLNYFVGPGEIRIPKDLPDGSYFLIGVADVENKVLEMNKHNNERYVIIRIAKNPQDFTILQLSTEDKQLVAGASLRLHVQESQDRNNKCDHHTSFFLSNDSLYSSGDRYLDDSFISVDEEATSVSWQPIVNLPKPLAAGRYYLVAVADHGNACIEYNEGNNTKALAIEVQPDWTTGLLSDNTPMGAGFQVYPNPSSGIFKLSVEEDIERLEVTNAQGKLLETLDTQTVQNTTLDLRHLESGMYMIKALSDGDMVGQQRLVIVR